MNFIKYTLRNNFIVFVLQLIVNIGLSGIIINHYTINSVVVEWMVFYLSASLIVAILFGNLFKYRRYQQFYKPANDDKLH